MEEEEKAELEEKDKIVDTVNNLQQLLAGENIKEEEMEKKIKGYLKPLSENLKTIIEDIEQTKKEQDKEIESHNEFVIILESISQYTEVKELIQKEKELATILEKEKLLLEKYYLTSKSILDVLSFIQSEDIVSTSKNKSKLQYEIDIITEDLRDKGIIKR